MSTTEQQQLRFLRALLRPVVRYCLSHSVGIQVLIECAKAVAVDVARENLDQHGAKVNVSRLSVMTGLHRRDVARLSEQGESLQYQSGMISRVVGQWEHDTRFHSRQGEPRVLSVEGEESEFKQLVRLVSSDVNPAAVLFELERVGAVERTKRGVKLSRTNYVPSGMVDEGLGILARDTEDLIAAVEENLSHQDAVPHLHGRTEYDNIAMEKLSEIREWLFREGTAFHLKVRSYLSRFDKDINPNIGGPGGGRVVLGTFSRIVKR